MVSEKLLVKAMINGCPFIHENRVNAVLKVSQALRKSQNLTSSQMARCLEGSSDIKHKIKMVDRLEGNEHLHEELSGLYKGLSDYILSYLSTDKTVPIIIDVCFMKDDRAIQMLSAEVAWKGRSIPLYREVFKEGELKEQTQSFLEGLKECVPLGRQVIVIMDAGFHCEWFKAIESYGWYWICRVRAGKSFYLREENNWYSAREFMEKVKEKTRDYEEVLLTKEHEHICRMVTTRRSPKGRKDKTSRGKDTGKKGRGRYRSGSKEPWLLATNLPKEFKAVQIVLYYMKRMQIEESFRDIKNHQFGLCARQIRTRCIHRWGVKMLLAAIVQITYWVVGVIAHSQNMQKVFQGNTVRDKKVFSYFMLGKLFIEHDKMHLLKFNMQLLPEIIQNELDRKW
ncbi:MAG: IS4 family transposase [Bacteroidetes bacterium]|nr:IS4 family transposase [Bacteroidota bacterium]